MKDIIYLDKNFLHSFIAQSNQGLPTATTHEISQQDTKSSGDLEKKENSHEVQAQTNTGAFQIPFIGTSPNGNFSYKNGKKSSSEVSYSYIQTDAGKEIIAKQLHDNALIEFEDYLEENNILVKLNPEIIPDENHVGRYIKIQSKFTLFDLDYIKKVLNPQLLPLFPILKSLGLTDDEKNNEMETLFKSIEFLVDYLTGLLPTSLYLKQENFVSPIKLEFLRENSSELTFKYGTSPVFHATVIGKITRIFDSFESVLLGGSEDFKTISKFVGGVVDNVLTSAGTIKKGNAIIYPIAIYFE
ncbi:DUF6414 family protein [Paenibacillus larvae]|uniref:Uncharacterized protein n=1 Tax=Paenibacillus larvae subsp. larvae TaxID=147375 RepID=A0A6C0QQS9_9BACL|nr:hypothetical protein [Paenibacillus larvae]QHZ50940.1 hypothetical protein ERICV_01785 [Paenibacillus larvae subsp. larvae]